MGSENRGKMRREGENVSNHLMFQINNFNVVHSPYDIFALLVYILYK